VKLDGQTGRPAAAAPPTSPRPPRPPRFQQAGAVEAFLDVLEGTSGIEPHGPMVLRHGHVIAAGWWAPYAVQRPHALYSLARALTDS
jgi:hypothetical protein